MNRPTLSVLILAASLLVPSLVHAGEVRVRFVGLESAQGSVRAALFASEAAYLADERTQGATAKVEGTTAEVVFADLAPGSYGISAFQDLNENESLDKNFVGMPKEPYGFSNNARGRFGPPDFEAFSFRVGSEPVVLEIQLQ